MSIKCQLNQWQDWNAQGFIPGPEETENAFINRIAFCDNLEQNLEQKVGADLPFEVGDQNSQNLLDEVLPFTQELYGIRPRWVPLFFSNYQLSFWHGGCAWIFQLDQQSPTAAFLQLRAQFRHFATYLGIYQRRELIAHELSHVGRMLYQEPQFEEILAYQSSSSLWRRWLGPIVQSSKESLFFILIIGVVVLTDFALLSLQTSSAAMLMWWTKLIPLLLLIFALARLFYRHRVFNHCLKNLEKLSLEPKIARHLIYRLRDDEIKQFAHLTPSQIQSFIDQAAQSSFRWLFLKTLYFS